MLESSLSDLLPTYSDAAAGRCILPLCHFSPAIFLFESHKKQIVKLIVKFANKHILSANN